MFIFGNLHLKNFNSNLMKFHDQFLLNYWICNWMAAELFGFFYITYVKKLYIFRNFRINKWKF